MTNKVGDTSHSSIDFGRRSHLDMMWVSVIVYEVHSLVHHKNDGEAHGKVLLAWA